MADLIKAWASYRFAEDILLSELEERLIKRARRAGEISHSKMPAIIGEFFETTDDPGNRKRRAIVEAAARLERKGLLAEVDPAERRYELTDKAMGARPFQRG